MIIELVSHCYAETHPHFAYCLQAQLLSIRHNRPNCGVKVTVCCIESDTKTVEVIQAEEDWVSPLYMNTVEELGRRAVGRNRAALFTAADIIWFTDVDHLFVDNVLDDLCKFEWPEYTTMIYPKDIMISKNHKTGDLQSMLARNGWSHCFNKKDFIPKHYWKAIGGVQIIKGAFARNHGYLNNTKWMTCFNKKPFGDFKDDMAYRKFHADHGIIQGVDLPGVYRLRHSTTSYQ